MVQVRAPGRRQTLYLVSSSVMQSMLVSQQGSDAWLCNQLARFAQTPLLDKVCR